MASGRRSPRPLTNKVEVSYFLSQEAEEELAEAIAFYREQASTSVANAFLSEFTRAARLVAENPGLGKPTSRGRRRLPRTAFLTRLTRSSTARKMKVYASEPSRITVAALAIGARANEPRAVLMYCSGMRPKSFPIGFNAVPCSAVWDLQSSRGSESLNPSTSAPFWPKTTETPRQL